MTTGRRPDISLGNQILNFIPAMHNHGGWIYHHLGLDICFDEHSYHKSPQVHLMEGIGY